MADTAGKISGHHLQFYRQLTNYARRVIVAAVGLILAHSFGINSVGSRLLLILTFFNNNF